MYKYNCRQCHIRNRCIDESNNADSIKIMLGHAFEARTDTLATWGRLQTSCLLVKLERENDQQPTTALSRRLLKVRKAKEQVNNTTANGYGASKQSVARRNGYIGGEEMNERDKNSSTPPPYLQPVSHLELKYRTGPLKPLSSTQPRAHPESQLYWLTVENTWRHISLPVSGALVLGRFDPGIGTSPDIDLAYEDERTRLLSRRHASIMGANGKYTVEDLGSKSGVFLNGERLAYGPSRPLKPGDHLKLGGVQLIFDKVPPIVLQSAKNEWTRHILTVAATGHKLAITPPHPVLIGHSDRRVNFVPDIDMGRYGAVAQRVSRRHAHIQWRDGQPYVEDLGSGFGTRLRGELLPLGQAARLVPGDHIWLAGCVLAYDIEAVPVGAGLVA